MDLVIIYLFIPMEKKKLREKLYTIQQELTAPKVKAKDSKVEYAYRKAEQIIEEAKRIIKEKDLKCLIKVEVETIPLYEPKATYEYTQNQYGKEKRRKISESGLVMLNAVATLADCESDDKETANATVTLPLSSEQMSEGQLAGATISYAKKYALENLFALDNNDDLDDVQAQPNTASKPLTPQDATLYAQFQKLKTSLANGTKSEIVWENVIKYFTGTKYEMEVLELYKKTLTTLNKKNV